MEKNLEEKVSIILRKTSPLVIGALTAGLLFSAGCGPTPEEECCDCLVENGCTDVSKGTCKSKLHGGGSFKVYTDCVKKNGCYAPCVEAGAYFK